MAFYKQYGGINRSSRAYITNSFIGINSRLGITQGFGQAKSVQIFECNTDIRDNALLDVGYILFHDGSVQNTAYLGGSDTSLWVQTGDNIAPISATEMSVVSVFATDISATTVDATTIEATSVVTASITTTSDRRIKSDIRPIDSGVVCDLLNPVEYTNLVTGKTDMGLIADEVLGVFPFLVHTGSDGMQSVNYMGLIALLIKEVQELKRGMNCGCVGKKEKIE